jgi:hypothetical protein
MFVPCGVEAALLLGFIWGVDIPIIRAAFPL